MKRCIFSIFAPLSFSCSVSGDELDNFVLAHFQAAEQVYCTPALDEQKRADLVEK